MEKEQGNGKAGKTGEAEAGKDRQTNAENEQVKAENRGEGDSKDEFENK